jgi:glycosyltransferase involved in cell wall biosynthesis
MKDATRHRRVLIVVPAFNEERHIVDLLGRLGSWKADVLVIDDGSTDRTAELVKRAGYKCFERGINLGLTAFFATAQEYASENGYSHLISVDGDGQHDPYYIPEFINALQQHDLVSGDRFHDLAGIPDSKIASNLFAILLIRKYLGITFPDAACGFRAAKRSIFSETGFVPGFGIVYEMMIKHVLEGHTPGFITIPATYHPGDPGNTGMAEILGLLSAVMHHHPDPELTEIATLTKMKSGFRLDLSGLSFEARFEEPEAYRFSTDQHQARLLFNLIHNQHGHKGTST